MTRIRLVVLGVLASLHPLSGQDVVTRARELERRGEAAEARQLLRRTAENAPNDPAVLSAYAEFLDRYRDPAAREVYDKLLGLLSRPDQRSARAATARRLVLLSLMAGDRAGAARYLEVYRAAGGGDWPAGVRLEAPPAEEGPYIEIPGPFESFARMAAVSQEIPPGELLAALARNVVTNGYQASSGNEALEPTEYMKLLVRYISQARELERFAGAEKVIRVESCESPQAGELLRILGYRMRGACGSEVVLETVNATRAFLTIDSGFPVAELEQALRTNRPFVYDFKPTRVPILYGADYWLGAREKGGGDFIDAYLADPALCRLYLGLSKLDRETADELRKAVPVQRLRAFAHVLDFYGGMFEIRNGRALVPGGARCERAWEELVGVSPAKGAEFFERLISKDDGWLASFFDALARIHGPVKDYLTEPERMKRFYMAVRGRVTSPGPARPVFRANTEMLLLTHRLRLEPDGRPHIPGNLEIWKNLFIKHPHGKYDGRLTRLATTWTQPDDLIEALFALCRKAVENEPLKIFMALSDINRYRSKPLEAATVDRLARKYRDLGAQYSIFNDAPTVTDKTILQFVDVTESIDRIRNSALRADTAGTMQALVGIWQILCRQGAIPASEADAALAGLLAPFAEIGDAKELFDAGRNGVGILLKAAGVPADQRPQDRLLDLLAGTAQPSDADAHARLVEEMTRILEAQKLISLNTLFELADHLEALPRGEKLNTALVNRIASRLAELQLPRTFLSSIERNAFAFGYWTERHIEAQRRLNLQAAIERAGTDAGRLAEIRGSLAPLLRDTLVGLNYAHYAPPGAQVLYTNPQFVRSHDFLGMQGTNQTWRATDVFGSGWPSNAGGRLVGSLSGLAYALAEAEQNFMVPSREQALIWGDLVPQMILSAKIPRWWNVSPSQMHWVGLHMRYAESLVAEASLDSELRRRVLDSLSRLALPARVRRVASALEAFDVREAWNHITPLEAFALAREVLESKTGPENLFAAEIRRMAAEAPDRINYQVISRAFGTPKPTLTNSYQPELLYLRTLPTLMGYSSRIMAESWESNTLYWAALADEMHLSPGQLNLLIPEWTRQTVERIFATHLEDWPAVLRSLRNVGEDIRLRARKEMLVDQKASLE
jgi:hypothetical protein